MADTLATCAQIRLEVLYSARSADDYEKLSAELLALPHSINSRARRSTLSAHSRSNTC